MDPALERLDTILGSGAKRAPSTSAPSPSPARSTPQGGRDPALDQLDTVLGGGSTGNLSRPNQDQNQGLLGDLGTDVKRGAMQLPGMVTGLADIPVALATGENYVSQAADWLGEQTGFTPGEWADEAVAEYSPERQAVRQNIDQTWDQTQEDGFQLSDLGTAVRPYLENPAHAVGGLLAESLPSIAAGGGIGKGVQMVGGALKAAAPTLSKFLTKASPYLGEAAVVSGQTMDQLGDTDADPRTAAMASLGAGATTYAAGQLTGTLANKLGVGDVEQMVTPGYRQSMDDLAAEAADPVRAAFPEPEDFAPTPDGPGLAKRLPLGMALEGTEEMVQGSAEQMWQNAATGEDVLAGVPRAAIEGTLAGGAMGAMTNVLPQPRPEGPGDAYAGLETADDIVDRTSQGVEEALAGLPPTDPLPSQRGAVAPDDPGADPAPFEQPLHRLPGETPTTSARKPKQDKPKGVLAQFEDDVATRLQNGDDPAALREELEAGKEHASLKGRKRKILERLVSERPRPRPDLELTPGPTGDAPFELTPPGEQQPLGPADQQQAFDFDANNPNQLDLDLPTPDVDTPPRPRPSQSPATQTPAGQPGDAADQAAATQADPAAQQATPDIVAEVATQYPELNKGSRLVRKNGQPNKQATDFASRTEQALTDGADPNALIQAEDGKNLNPTTFETRRRIIEGLAARRAVTQPVDVPSDQTPVAEQEGTPGTDLAPTPDTTALVDSLRSGSADTQEALAGHLVGAAVKSDLPAKLGGATSATNPDFNESPKAKEQGITAEDWFAGALVRLLWDNKAGAVDPETGNVNVASLRNLEDQFEALVRQAEATFGTSPIYNKQAQGKDGKPANRHRISRQSINKKLKQVAEALNDKDSPLYEVYQSGVLSRDDTYDPTLEPGQSFRDTTEDDDTPNPFADDAALEQMAGANARPTLEAMEDGTYVAESNLNEGDRGGRLVNEAVNSDRISKHTRSFVAETLGIAETAVKTVKRKRGDGTTYQEAVPDNAAIDAALREAVGKDRAADFNALVSELMSVDLETGKQIVSSEQAKPLLEAKFAELRAAHKKSQESQQQETVPESNTTQISTDTTDAVAARIKENEASSRRFYDNIVTFSDVAMPSFDELSERDREIIDREAAKLEGTSPAVRTQATASALRKAINYFGGVYGQRARTPASDDEVAGGVDEADAGASVEAAGGDPAGMAGGESPGRRDGPGPRVVTLTADDTLSPRERRKRQLAAQREAQGKRSLPDDGPLVGGTTAQAVNDTINQALGGQSRTRLHVYQSVEDAVAAGVEQSDAETAKAWVQRGNDGRWHAFFIADHIKPGRELGVFLHEIGSHLGIDGLLDQGTRNQLALQIKRWALKNDGSQEAQLARKALDRVKKAQRAGDATDVGTAVSERIAYFLEEAANAGVIPQALSNPSTPFGRFFEMVFRALRRAIDKVGLGVQNLNTQDMVDMALGMANYAIKEDNVGPAYQEAASYSRRAEQTRKRLNRPKRERDNAFGRRFVDHVASIKHTTTNKILFHWMSIEQLADQFGERIPEMRTLSKLFNKMEAFSLHTLSNVQDIDRHWADLTQAENELLSEVQRTATRLEFDPDPESDNHRPAATKEERELVRQWNRLGELSQQRINKNMRKARSPKRRKKVQRNQWSAHKIYREVRNHYQADLDAAMEHVEKVVKAGATEGDDGVLAAREQGLLKIISSLKARRNMPYFPLRRLGNWYTVGMSAPYARLKQLEESGQITDDQARQMRELEKSDKHFVVSGHDSRAQAERHQRELKAQGFTHSYFNETKQHLRTDPTQVMPKLDEFESMLQRTGVDATAMQTLKENYESLLIASSPDNSMLRRLIERKGVHGEETDMRRVFADTGQTRAFALSRLVYSRDIDEALSALNAKTSPKVGDTSGDHELATSLYNTMRNRQQLAFDPQEVHPVARWMSSVSYMSLLGASPAFWLLNLSQVPLVTLPWLSARNGNKIGQTFHQLTKNAVQMGKLVQWSMHNELSADVDWEKAKATLTSGEFEMLQYLRDQGQLDFTIGYDLAAIAQGKNDKLDKVTRSINAPSTATEIVNRGSTALTAYRVKLAQTRDHQAAMEFAREAASTTQVNYSPVNVPPAMQRLLGSKSLAAVAFQFWRYQQGMAYLTLSTLRNIRAESPEQRKEARDTALGLSATTMLSAGAMGLPFMSSIMGGTTLVANILQDVGGDDDREWDIERELKNLIHDIAPEIAPYINNGVLNEITGWDIGSRTEMGGLMNPWTYSRMRPGASGRDTASEALFGLAGAPVSNIVGMYDGLKLAADGNYDKALEKLFPLKGARDLVKGYNLSADGMTQRDGGLLQPAEEFTAWERFGQFIGFSPDSKGQYYEANDAIQRRKRVVQDARRKLFSQYHEAYRKRDGEATNDVLRAIHEFNMRNPYEAITADALLQSVQRRNRNQALRDERGVLRSEQNLPYLEQARWAD